MTKPIIALYRNLKTEHVNKIREIASDYLVKTQDELSERDFEAIEIILGWNYAWQEEEIAKMHALKWIQNDTAGMDSLPEVLRHSQTIKLSNMSGIHADSIAQSVFAFLLSYYRGFFQALMDQFKANWNKTYVDNVLQTNDKVILLFGTGALSCRIAELAQQFGMVVYGINTDGRSVEHFDKTFKTEDWLEVIGEVDVVINTMPLTDQTRDFFNTKLFEAMSSDALFINVGRGESVVEEDLIRALDNKTIAGAYLDVARVEPLPADNPLWQTDNLVITPHISGIVEHFRDAVFNVFTENLQQYLADGTLAKNQFNRTKNY